MERTRFGSEGRPCILVIHDVEDVRRLLVRMLETEGYRVAAASSESEAIQAAGSLMPDLIVQILGQSAADAVATALRVRNGASLAGVPVIIVGVSGGTCTDVEMGGDLHLLHLEDSEQLKLLVARLLTGRLLPPG